MYSKDYNGGEKAGGRESRNVRKEKATKGEKEHFGCYARIWVEKCRIIFRDPSWDIFAARITTDFIMQ